MFLFKQHTIGLCGEDGAASQALKAEDSRTSFRILALVSDLRLLQNKRSAYNEER